MDDLSFSACPRLLELPFDVLQWFAVSTPAPTWTGNLSSADLDSLFTAENVAFSYQDLEIRLLGGVIVMCLSGVASLMIVVLALTSFWDMKAIKRLVLMLLLRSLSSC